MSEASHTPACTLCLISLTNLANNQDTAIVLAAAMNRSTSLDHAHINWDQVQAVMKPHEVDATRNDMLIRAARGKREGV